MPRRDNAEWKPSLKTRLNITTLVRKFNSKLTRELKKNAKLEGNLPDRLNVTTVTNNLKSYQDFRNFKESVNRLFRAGAFELESYNGFTLTKYQENEIRLLNKRVDKKLQAENEKLTEASPEIGNIHSVRNASFAEHKFNPEKMRKSEFESFLKRLYRQADPGYLGKKIFQYKLNYIAAVKNKLGQAGEKILELVRNIPADVLYYIETANPELSIEFVYDEIEAERIARRILEEWNAYMTANKEEVAQWDEKWDVSLEDEEMEVDKGYEIYRRL